MSMETAVLGLAALTLLAALGVLGVLAMVIWQDIREEYNNRKR